MDTQFPRYDYPIVVGGFGEKKSNRGTQWYEQDRVYSGECVATAIPAEASFHPWYLVEEDDGIQS